MSEARRLQKQTVPEVSSLLIPLVARTLLVPTVTVAEMVPYRRPDRDPEAPDWFLGTITWRDEKVPLVSYEVLSGEAMPAYSESCRIAVLNNVGVDENLPFLAIAAQGIPRLARIKEEELHELEAQNLKRFDLMQVSHAGEDLVIPDVAALEQAFVDYRASIPQT